MICSLLCALSIALGPTSQAAKTISGAQPTTILFLGNSHTGGHGIPEMVRALLASAGLKASVKAVYGSFLDDLAANPGVLAEVDSGRWRFVVLQGAKLSSSHKFEYSKQPGVNLALRALKAGVTPVLFAEHPRRGWDEAAWQYGQYRQIQKKVSKEASGKQIGIAPVCYAFATALKRNPRLDLWELDGNHANLAGSFLSAATISLFLVPQGRMAFVPKGIEPVTAKTLLSAAEQTVRDRR